MMMLKSERGVGNLGLILFLTLILIALIAGIIIGAHNIGLINAKNIFYPYFEKVPYVGKYFKKTTDIGKLLPEEILKKQEEALGLREKQLEEKTKKLNELKESLDKKDIELKEKEKDLLAKEKAILLSQREQETTEKKLKRQAFYFGNMKPDQAALKLAELPEELTIEILKRIEDQKTVAVILMKMSAEKAANIIRKMSR